MTLQMPCPSVEASLSELIAGDLDPRLAESVRAHLAGCASCRREEAELRPLLALLAEDAAAEGGIPDPGARYWDAFAGRVRTARAARERAAAPGLLGWLRAPRLALAAGVALLVWSVARLPAALDREIAAREGADAELFADLIPVDDPLESIGDLSESDMDALEAGLLAGNAAAPKKTPVPAATPKPTPVPKAAKKPASDVWDAPPAGSGSTLDGIDDLTPEQMDELLRQLNAMKT